MRRHLRAVTGGDAGAIRVSTVAYGLITVVAALALIDTGSIAVTRLALGDNVKESGRAAVESVGTKRPTPAVAMAAYVAASGVASERAEFVREEGFVVNANGSVTLTLQKMAPTLIAKHFSFLAAHADVRVTWTQIPIQI